MGYAICEIGNRYRVLSISAVPFAYFTAIAGIVQAYIKKSVLKEDNAMKDFGKSFH